MTNALIAARDRFAAAHPEQRFARDGRDWGFRDVGAGPVLLLIPGTLGRGDVFFQQIEALSDRLRIVAVSYPASGSVGDWAGDLFALLDQLGIERASILGSSLGGYLVQWMAAVAPARIDRLIPANTLSDSTGMDQRPPYSLDLLNAPIADLRAGFHAGLGGWRAAHPEQADVVELLLGEADGRILEPELRARLNALKVSEPLPDLDFPAARIATIEADDDPLIPPPLRAGVRARLAPAVAYRFLSGGHFPYLARPAAYTGLLEQVMGLNPTGEDWGQGKERAL